MLIYMLTMAATQSQRLTIPDVFNVAVESRSLTSRLAMTVVADE
jgi:hypothetical protein